MTNADEPMFEHVLQSFDALLMVDDTHTRGASLFFLQTGKKDGVDKLTEKTHVLFVVLRFRD